MGTLKVFLSCAAAVVCVLLFVDQQGKDSTREDQREVRWLTTVQSQYDHSSPYTMNLWYRYAKYVANNLTNCYVCSHMPLAVHTPLIRPQPFRNTPSLFPDILSSNYQDAVLNQTVRPLTGITPPRPPPAGQGNRNFSKYFHVVNSKFEQPFLGPVHIPAHVKFTCYTNRNGILGAVPIPVGETSRFHCQEVIVPCTPFQANKSLNISQAPPGTRCAPYYQAPDMLGTLPQQDLYWLCGHFLYLALPPNWAGICAPVVATGHSYVVTTSNIQLHLKGTRHHRSADQPHDSIWGSNVPKDKKLWTEGEKVILSLLAPFGVGKVMLRIETLNYKFESFAADTVAAFKGVQTELTALRLTALQNRMVLD